MATAPLSGVRVIDLCQLWAGGFCGMLLGDMGAEVIKVENIHHWQYGVRGFITRPTKEFLRMTVPLMGGYPNREPGERPWDRVPMFHGHAKHKMSATIDLRQPKGKEYFKRLVKVCDIVVDGNAPDMMEKLGLDYPQLKAVKEDIIMVRMPGYGLSGPYRNFPALAMNLEAFSGHPLLRGYRDADPTLTTQTVASNAAAGAGAALAAVMALFYRKRTGRGQKVELAQVENFVHQLSPAVMDYSLNKRVQTPLGNRSPSAAPCGLYPAKGQDRWLAITVHNDEEWAGLCGALGNPSWCGDAKFADHHSRYQNQDELDAHLSEWTRQHDHYEAMHILQREGVPAAPVVDEAEAYADPHLNARGFFQRLNHREAGSYLIPSPLWRLPRTPLSIQRPAPCLGEHNEYVYKKLIGVSDEEYAELEREGFLGTVPDETWP